MKLGNLNFLEPSGPLQARNGTALPLFLKYHGTFKLLTISKLNKCYEDIIKITY